MIAYSVPGNFIGFVILPSPQACKHDSFVTENRSWSQTYVDCNPDSPFLHVMTLGKSFRLSKPQNPHVYKKNLRVIHMPVLELLWEAHSSQYGRPSNYLSSYYPYYVGWRHCGSEKLSSTLLSGQAGIWVQICFFPVQQRGTAQSPGFKRWLCCSRSFVILNKSLALFSVSLSLHL